MKKVTGTVTESLIVQKTVEVEVADDVTEEQAEEAIRAKAYEKSILIGEHGWEGVETSDVDVQIDSGMPCKYCGQDCFGDGGQGCDEAQAGGFAD